MAVQKSKKSRSKKKLKLFSNFLKSFENNSLSISSFSNFYNENQKNIFLIKCPYCRFFVNPKRGCLHCNYNYFTWAIKSPDNFEIKRYVESEHMYRDNPWLFDL